MLAQDTSGRGDKKCLSYGYIWKVEMTWCFDGLHIEIKIKTKWGHLGIECGQRTIEAGAKFCQSSNKNSETREGMCRRNEEAAGTLRKKAGGWTHLGSQVKKFF